MAIGFTREIYFAGGFYGNLITTQELSRNVIVGGFKNCNSPMGLKWSYIMNLICNL